MNTVKNFFLLVYAVIQFPTWLVCTISVVKWFSFSLLSINQDLPDNWFLQLIAYFIWTNYLIIEASKVSKN